MRLLSTLIKKQKIRKESGKLERLLFCIRGPNEIRKGGLVNFNN